MITKVSAKNEDIIVAGALIKSGELVAFPTETVYGLGGNALDFEASKKIYATKGRPSDNPLIVHLSNWNDIYKIAQVPSTAKVLFDAFCPGPLTMIMPKLPIIPDETTGGRNTVAIRFPSHPIARALIDAAGVPIAAPSANVSKHVSPTDAMHVYDDLKGRIPLILDGGACQVGIESTIVDLTTDVPTVLRPGAITKEQIAEVLGKAENFHGDLKEAKAPGMKYKHYSPNAPCYLVKATNLANAFANAKSEGKNAVAICSDSAQKYIPNENIISLGNSIESAENKIYGALRSAEKYDIIFVEDMSDREEYFAVMDRIKKATGGNVL